MLEALMVLLLDSGEIDNRVVPWTVCIAIHRDWRYADAIGKNYVHYNTRTGIKRYIREVRCEDRNQPDAVPTS